MPKQLQHGPLLQLADDACLICCGSFGGSVSTLLSKDLLSLSYWIAKGHMQVNVRKSSIMWFRIGKPKSGVPFHQFTCPLSCVDYHKYL